MTAPLLHWLESDATRRIHVRTRADGVQLICELVGDRPRFSVLFPRGPGARRVELTALTLQGACEEADKRYPPPDWVLTEADELGALDALPGGRFFMLPFQVNGEMVLHGEPEEGHLFAETEIVTYASFRVMTIVVELIGEGSFKLEGAQVRGGINLLYAPVLKRWRSATNSIRFSVDDLRRYPTLDAGNTATIWGECEGTVSAQVWLMVRRNEDRAAQWSPSQLAGAAAVELSPSPSGDDADGR